MPRSGDACHHGRMDHPDALRDWLSRPSPDVAPELLGCLVTSTSPEGTVSLRITEVEAYEGEADPASHAHRGPGVRNAVMFGEAGHAYVYLSHGIHWCLNVVTRQAGTASGVLLRAGQVVDGVDLARRRRGERVPDRSLARGPGCLGQALGVHGGLSGTDLLAPDAPLRLSTGPRPPAVAARPRVGVSRAAAVPWRWYVAGDPTVSAYRRSPRAPQP